MLIELTEEQLIAMLTIVKENKDIDTYQLLTAAGIQRKSKEQMELNKEYFFDSLNSQLITTEPISGRDEGPANKQE